MKRVIFSALLICSGFITELCAQTNLEYKILPSHVSISGTLRLMGRSSSDGTTSEPVYVLVPTRAVDIVSNPSDPKRNIVRIQLIPEADSKVNLRTYLNKPVQVIGVLRLPYAQTHYTIAVIDLKRIRIRTLDEN